MYMIFFSAADSHKPNIKKACMTGDIVTLYIYIYKLYLHSLMWT